MAKTSQPTRAPNKALYLTDYARSAWDIGALSVTLPALARAPRGDGHAVLVIPGLGASDRSTLILRRFLSTLGYATHGWELGRNIGPTARVVSGLPERLHEFRARHDGPVSVIGWSLGGIFARQLGRRHPDVIRQVITLASPIRLKDHAHSNARRAYELLEKQHTETIQLPLEAGLGPLPVPATSVYTRLDGIVAWRACLDQPSRHAENVEVYASHFGIGNHPAALWVIADRLTQPPGKWAPFRPPARWRCAYRGERGGGGGEGGGEGGGRVRGEGRDWRRTANGERAEKSECVLASRTVNSCHWQVGRERQLLGCGVCAYAGVRAGTSGGAAVGADRGTLSCRAVRYLHQERQDGRRADLWEQEEGYVTSERRVRRLARAEGLQCVLRAVGADDRAGQRHGGLVDLVDRSHRPRAGPAVGRRYYLYLDVWRVPATLIDMCSNKVRMGRG